MVKGAGPNSLAGVTTERGESVSVTVDDLGASLRCQACGGDAVRVFGGGLCSVCYHARLVGERESVHTTLRLVESFLVDAIERQGVHPSDIRVIVDDVLSSPGVRAAAEHNDRLSDLWSQSIEHGDTLHVARGVSLRD
jgi:hypothetical protein